MRVIEQPKWAFGSYRQVYECEVPEACANPVELAANFFQGQGAYNLEADDKSIKFSRGTWWKAVSLFERHLNQDVTIRVQNGDGRTVLVCEYRINSRFTVNVPPWQLGSEVEKLEEWLVASCLNRTGTDAGSPTVRVSVAKAATGASSYVPLPMNIGYKILYRIYRLLSWLRHWVSRRFTGAGLVMLGATSVAMILGIDPENSVGYQGFTLLVGMLTASFLFGWFFRVKFAAERLLPRFGTVGQPFNYRVSVRNLTKRNQEGLWLLENLRDIRPTFAQWKALQVDDNKYVRPFRFGQRRRQNPYRLAKLKDAPMPALRPNHVGEVNVELTPLRRGVVHFDGLTFARPDPLGIFRALRKVPLPQSVLILPKRYFIPPIALPGAMKYQQGGVALASNVGQSDEFVALRDYRRGDPMRHIHWRSWAKTGKPIVKEFEDEFFVRHALVLDTFTERPQSEEFEEAVSVAASFACTVLTQESLLDLLFVETQAYCFTAGRGLAHADQMLEILASVQPCNTLLFEQLDELVLNHANSVSGCICVLLAWDNARQRLVEKLKAFNLPVLVFVIRPFGKSEPLEPGPMRDEPERLIALEVGRVEQQLARLK